MFQTGCSQSSVSAAVLLLLLRRSVPLTPASGSHRGVPSVQQCRHPLRLSDAVLRACVTIESAAVHCALAHSLCNEAFVSHDT